jgi:hypothetical protein
MQQDHMGGEEETVTELRMRKTSACLTTANHPVQGHDTHRAHVSLLQTSHPPAAAAVDPRPCKYTPACDLAHDQLIYGHEGWLIQRVAQSSVASRCIRSAGGMSSDDTACSDAVERRPQAKSCKPSAPLIPVSFDSHHQILRLLNE